MSCLSFSGDGIGSLPLTPTRWSIIFTRADLSSLSCSCTAWTNPRTSKNWARYRMLLAIINEAVQAADRLVGRRYPQRSNKSNNHIDVFLIALPTWHRWGWLCVPLRSVSRPDLVATLPLPILSSVDAAAVCCCVLLLALTDHLQRSQESPVVATATEPGVAHQ